MESSKNLSKKRSIDDEDVDQPIKKTNDKTTIKKDRIKTTLFPIDAYTKHKLLMNRYVLNKPGYSFPKFEVKTDFDVLKQHHKFLWDSDEDDEASSDQSKLSYGERIAKRYYDRLYKEYCICDLSRYKENKIAMRWRIEKEVILGKGQFICGNKICEQKDDLKSWEVNFAYIENDEKKNALCKLRLCIECSEKLNYHHKKKEIICDRSTADQSSTSEIVDNEISQKVDDFLQSLLL